MTNIRYRTTSARKGQATIGHPFPHQSDIYTQITYPISNTPKYKVYITAQFVLAREKNKTQMERKTCRYPGSRSAFSAFWSKTPHVMLSFMFDTHIQNAYVRDRNPGKCVRPFCQHVEYISFVCRFLLYCDQYLLWELHTHITYSHLITCGQSRRSSVISNWIHI